MSERRYSRREVSLILRRATDGEIRAQSAQGGLTLAELVAAAREAGIDPEVVRRSALLSSPPTGPIARALLGAPITATVRARVPGRLRPEGGRALGPALDQAMERAGELEEAGSELIWREEHGIGRSEVSARPDGDAVELAASAERQGHALVLVSSVAMGVGAALIPLGGFAGLAALGGPLLALLAPVGAVAGATRLIWPLLERRTRRRLEAAVLEASALVEEEGAG